LSGPISGLPLKDLQFKPKQTQKGIREGRQWKTLKLGYPGKVKSWE